MKLKITFSIERVSDDWSCSPTVLMQVELTSLAAVFVADASFLTSITVERDLCVFKLLPVLRVNRVRDFFVYLHIYST